MLITETVTIDGVTYTHSYSDDGFLIEQSETGIVYDDALDVTPCPYSYTETDQPSGEDLYAEAGRILLGE